MIKKTTNDNDLGRLIQYFFQEYLPTHRGVSRNTIKSYRDTLKLFVAWLSENQRPTDSRLLLEIRTQDILGFLKHLEEKRSNSIATRNSRLAAIKAFFFMCYLIKPETKPTLEIIQFIPMKKMHTPLIDYFEHEDVVKILAAVDRSSVIGAKDYLVLSLLYDTGMRASELTSLKINGFDANHQTLEIIGKGNKWRRIRVWPRTARLVNDYVKNWRIPPKPLHQDILLINHKGTAMTRFGIHKVCQKYLKKANIQKQLPSAKRSAVHSWRHTAAVCMIRQGRSLLEVSVRLGHRQLDTTQKYLGLDLSIKKQRLDELIRFTDNILPTRASADSVALKTTEEMVTFLKSI